jgi:hypothetical protein
VIADIFKEAFKNIQKFIVIWVVVILINQVVIFGACFAPYCLIAALPHTSIIALVISYFTRDNPK